MTVSATPISLGLADINPTITDGGSASFSAGPVGMFSSQIDRDEVWSNGFPYFQKESGTLDYMGIKITATGASKDTQRAWAPGRGHRNAGLQEHPGGWITPGTWQLAVNTGRIHGADEGVLAGVARAGHQVWMVHITGIRDVEENSWYSHGHSDPGADGYNYNGQYWTRSGFGQQHEITVEAGDTIHVGYSDGASVNHEGSDGFEIYVTDGGPPRARGGLWGNENTWTYNETRWAKFVTRCRDIVRHTNIPSVSDFTHGPVTLPDPMPSDYQNDGLNDIQNNMTDTLGNWAFNRAAGYVVEGTPSRGTLQDLVRIITFALNAAGNPYCWSQDAGEENHTAHGHNSYEPYQRDVMGPIFMAAAMAGLTPGNCEPLRKALGWWAQRMDAAMHHFGDYYYINADIEGGIDANKDVNALTKWIWYDLGLRDVNSKGGGRQVGVWGMSVWARDILEYPLSAAAHDMLWYSGGRHELGDGWYHQGHGSYNPDNRHGHGCLPQGVIGAWDDFYCAMDLEGAMWMHFTDTYVDSQMMRWRTRGIQWYGSGASGRHHDPDNEIGSRWADWSWGIEIPFMSGITVSRNPTGVELNWAPNHHPDLDYYEVYRGAGYSGMSLYHNLIPSNVTTYTDPSGSSEAMFYGLKAVTTGGQPGDPYKSIMSEPWCVSAPDIQGGQMGVISPEISTS